MNNKNCIICDNKLKETTEPYMDGNNPEPIAEKGRCCDDCNETYVIPVRMAEAMRLAYSGEAFFFQGLAYSATLQHKEQFRAADELLNKAQALIREKKLCFKFGGLEN